MTRLGAATCPTISRVMPAFPPEGGRRLLRPETPREERCSARGFSSTWPFRRVSRARRGRRTLAPRPILGRPSEYRRLVALDDRRLPGGHAVLRLRRLQPRFRRIQAPSALGLLP